MRPNPCLIVLSGSLLFLNGTAAAATASDTTPAPDPASIQVPGDLGHVVSRYLPATGSDATTAASAPPKLVIHIQDAHVNYEAQKHLAAIIDRLMRAHDIRLVLAEGGEGDASLSFLRAAAPLEKRQAVAEQFLKAGKISGDEYVDLTVDYPFTLWGVESEALYDQNLAAFLSTEALRGRIQPTIAALRRALEPATQQRYPSALKTLIADAERYERGQLSFREHLEGVQQQMHAVGLSLTAYKSLTAFVESGALERELNMRQVQAEQTQALQALKQRAPAEEFASLMELGRAMSTQPHTAPRFYQRLERLLVRHNVLAPGAYPQLSRYLQHTRFSQQMDTARLAQELDRAVGQLRTVLAADPEVKALLTIDRDTQMLERLFALELTPEEYLAFAASLERTALQARWSAGLRLVRLREGVLRDIEEAIPRVAQFYTVARQRNHAMADRALAKMDELQAHTAILIAGGFHTPSLVRLLTDRGASVVVIAPTVNAPTDEALYHQMLKFKAGVTASRPETSAVR